MFPIRDHNPSGRVPFVTYALIALNVVVFVSYAGASNTYANFLFVTYGVQPVEIVNGVGWPTLLTSMFLHGGWMHLIGNMLFLWIFGDNVEDEMGHWPYLGFYVAAGCLAAFVQIISEPFSRVPMVGASGAIAGVMGGYLLLFPKARVDIFLFFIVFFKILPIPAWIVLMVWFAMQFFGGLGTAAGGGGVAYWAHAGGFLAGVLLTLPVWIRRGGPEFWSRTAGHPPHPEARYRLQNSRIPKIRRK